jgi:hypothetical protein
MRCFISISKNVTNKHLSILQTFVILFNVTIATIGTTLSLTGHYVVLPTKSVLSPQLVLVTLVFALVMGTIMSACFIYLLYLVRRYMKDSNLGPPAMLLLKDNLKSAKVHFASFFLFQSIGATSLVVIVLLNDEQKELYYFLAFSILCFCLGVVLFSMSLLVGYAVQITQVSIKSRQKLLT